MRRILTSSLVCVACALSLARLSADINPRVPAPTTRTVYFSATDAKGVPVTDLTAADLTVEEAGKAREVVSLRPATGPFQVSILVDDSGLGSFQAGVKRFINATLDRGEYAISLLNPQPNKLTDYITNIDGLNAALLKLVQRGRIQLDDEQLIEGISWASNELRQRKAPRPVILALTNVGEPPASERRDTILGDLRRSAASLNVVFINGVPFGKVLSDGPKHSGGLLQNAASSQGVDDAVAKVASNLLNQYVLTYLLPDGTKPTDRVRLTTTRKGVTLLTPERIPDQ